MTHTNHRTCTACKDILNDQAEWTGDEDCHGAYACKCGNVSGWHFGIAPVPICLQPNGQREQRGHER